jgi:hypothetical protein
MNNKLILAAVFAFTLLVMHPASAGASSNLVPYKDAGAGFTFNYPDYWPIVKDVNKILSIQDGSIDLIRQEALTAGERSSYKVMVHVDGSPKYVSNTVVMAYPHRAGGKDVYSSSEDAVNAVKLSFEDSMASGTFFLEETYLGESHTFVYRRTVNVPQWNDQIRITYYIAASKSHAYMMVESVLLSQLDDSAYKDQFNQVAQSFRILDNEPSTPVTPPLNWGTQKPGGTNSNVSPDVGKIEIHENFDNNNFNWPISNIAKIENGRYVLDSRNGYPFTDTNTNLGMVSFDFSFQGDVNFIDGDAAAGYGLVFGYIDKDNYFTYLINNSGRFMLAQESNGQIVELIPWTESPVLVGSTHTLMVQGDYMTVPEGGTVSYKYSISFLVDGTEISRSEVNNVLSITGQLGLYVSKGVEVSFDSLVSRNFLLTSVMTLDRPVL